VVFFLHPSMHSVVVRLEAGVAHLRYTLRPVPSQPATSKACVVYIIVVLGSAAAGNNMRQAQALNFKRCRLDPPAVQQHEKGREEGDRELCIMKGPKPSQAQLD
ncbi:hypothetical protein CBL_21227, partial [Carabus blaptoides fortunei]